MVITTVICYLVCWIPYGVIALLATFGRPGVVTPVASVIPSILAKSSTVCNPIIYILMNKQVRRVLLLNCIFFRVCWAFFTTVTTSPIDVSLWEGHSRLVQMMLLEFQGGIVCNQQYIARQEEHINVCLLKLLVFWAHWVLICMLQS